jgi:hypothetical protein
MADTMADMHAQMRQERQEMHQERQDMRRDGSGYGTHWAHEAIPIPTRKKLTHTHYPSRVQNYAIPIPTMGSGYPSGTHTH